jgi:hypothetical protein
MIRIAKFAPDVHTHAPLEATPKQIPDEASYPSGQPGSTCWVSSHLTYFSRLVSHMVKRIPCCKEAGWPTDNHVESSNSQRPDEKGPAEADPGNPQSKAIR